MHTTAAGEETGFLSQGELWGHWGVSKRSGVFRLERLILPGALRGLLGQAWPGLLVAG